MLLKQIPLFVYGTLRSDGPNAPLVKPYVTVCRRAEAWGSLHYVDYLDDQGEPARTVTYSPEGDSRIEGELLTLAPQHNLIVLAQLDRKELNFGLAGPPCLQATCVFVRQLIVIKPDGESPLVAWTYVLASADDGLGQGVQLDTDGIVRYAPRQRNGSHPIDHTTLEGCA